MNSKYKFAWMKGDKERKIEIFNDIEKKKEVIKQIVGNELLCGQGNLKVAIQEKLNRKIEFKGFYERPDYLDDRGYFALEEICHNRDFRMPELLNYEFVFLDNETGFGVVDIKEHFLRNSKVLRHDIVLKDGILYFGVFLTDIDEDLSYYNLNLSDMFEQNFELNQEFNKQISFSIDYIAEYAEKVKMLSIYKVTKEEVEKAKEIVKSIRNFNFNVKF